MSTFVKICGLRDKEGIAAAVAAGADALGFVFAESVRRVTPADAKAAAQDMPDGVLRVAVMRHPSADTWQAVLETFAPDVLQTEAGDFERLDIPDEVRRWPVYRQGQVGNNGVPDGVYLYEGATSGVGNTVDWTEAARVAARGRMILAGGLAPGNVGRALATVRPFGVDVSSGVESAPGVKDATLIREFIGAVRAAEAAA